MAKSLLIIDAEGKYAAIASVALKASGWTTATVLSLPAALSRIGEMMPDALLCPADLEGMSERQLAAAIRDRKGCSRLPVILVGSKTYAGPNFFATPAPLSATALTLLMQKIEARKPLAEELAFDSFDSAFDSIMGGVKPKGEEPKPGDEGKKTKGKIDIRLDQPAHQPQDSGEPSPDQPEGKKEPPPEPKEAPKAKTAASFAKGILKLLESWIIGDKSLPLEGESYRLEKEPAAEPPKPAAPPKFGLATPAAEVVAATAAVAMAEKEEEAKAERPKSAKELEAIFKSLLEEESEAVEVAELDFGEEEEHGQDALLKAIEDHGTPVELPAEEPAAAVEEPSEPAPEAIEAPETPSPVAEQAESLKEEPVVGALEEEEAETSPSEELEKLFAEFSADVEEEKEPEPSREISFEAGEKPAEEIEGEAPSVISGEATGIAEEPAVEVAAYPSFGEVELEEVAPEAFEAPALPMAEEEEAPELSLGEIELGEEVSPAAQATEPETAKEVETAEPEILAKAAEPVAEEAAPEAAEPLKEEKPAGFFKSLFASIKGKEEPPEETRKEEIEAIGLELEPFFGEPAEQKSEQPPEAALELEPSALPEAEEYGKGGFFGEEEEQYPFETPAQAAMYPPEKPFAPQVAEPVAEEDVFTLPELAEEAPAAEPEPEEPALAAEPAAEIAEEDILADLEEIEVPPPALRLVEEPLPAEAEPEAEFVPPEEFGELELEEPEAPVEELSFEEAEEEVEEISFEEPSAPPAEPETVSLDLAAIEAGLEEDKEFFSSEPEVEEEPQAVHFDFASAESELKIEGLLPKNEAATAYQAAPAIGHAAHDLDFDELDGALGELEGFTPDFRPSGDGFDDGLGEDIDFGSLKADVKIGVADNVVAGGVGSKDLLPDPFTDDSWGGFGEEELEPSTRNTRLPSGNQNKS